MARCNSMIPAHLSPDHTISQQRLAMHQQCPTWLLLCHRGSGRLLGRTGTFANWECPAKREEEIEIERMLIMQDRQWKKGWWTWLEMIFLRRMERNMRRRTSNDNNNKSRVMMMMKSGGERSVSISSYKWNKKLNICVLSSPSRSFYCECLSGLRWIGRRGSSCCEKTLTLAHS